MSRLLRTGDPDALTSAARDRLAAWRTAARRWWYRDRAWLGRCVALAGNRIVIDGARFTLTHPDITDEIRARMLRGRYELAERTILKAWLREDRPVIELGGGLGVISTLINRRLRHPEQHVVVEANPTLIPVLERHRAANGGRFVVEHGAIAYSGGRTARLSAAGPFIAARIGSTSPQTVEVPAFTVADLVRRYPFMDATLVCDVEGVEAQIVEHDAATLRRHFSVLVIEMHPEVLGAAGCATVVDRLRAAGFSEVACVRKVRAFAARRAAR